ncbi:MULTISPECIES: EamA family transporter [unclassified Crossiella]|uniref:EamA family transporter n=1 Tax=unclassified Crossiella TaxID=2620835 RepID=UPI001FFFA1BF|nr:MULTISPECIES: EamA family transporter [unclassified Crossiella]MCK2243927.1 EamA family transporter [Crossiella sp. S99.2]MCK2257215.1 EamA family transporter [Crossiella sp. S99.1]
MKPAHVALAVLVALIWGLNFVVIQVGLAEVPPFLFSALRFTVAALPALFFVGSPRVAWRWVLLMGLTLGVVKFGLLFGGMYAGAPAGLSSLVLQSQVLFTVLFAALLLKERPTPLRLAGTGIALAGMVLVVLDYGAGSPLGALLMVVAAAAVWSLTNIITRYAAPPDMLRFMVWVSAVPILPLFALSATFEGVDTGLNALAHLDFAGVGAVLYVGWAATLAGFGIWGFLLRSYPATAVAPFSLLVPVFGMSSAALLLHEQLTTLRMLAAGLVIIGVALASGVVRTRPRRDRGQLALSAESSYGPMPSTQARACVLNSSTSTARQ